MSNMMIQNSISQRQQVPNKNLIQEPAQKTSYTAHKVGAAPYEAKGYIVHTPIWKAPVVAVENTIENIRNIGKGLKGDSDDHRLGKMNNTAMMAGGLGIASYLASTRVLPVKKGMEFVGFGAFLAAMGLSKVLIDAPVKALYGFDNNMKYVDSQGRKKPFFSDPLYVAWDAVPAEEINRIGDKMKIDPTLDNREDLIKEKTTKIATQANTMWMLTAGITTPIIGALISSGIEKAMGSIQEKRATAAIENKMSKLGQNLENADKIASDKQDQKGLESMVDFLNKNKDKETNGKFVDQLINFIDKGNNEKLSQNIRKDVQNIMKETEVADVSEFLGDIEIKVPATLDPNSKETITHTFSKENIKKCLEGANGQKDINSNQILNGSQADVYKKRLSVLFNEEMNKKYPGGDDEVETLVERLNDAFSSTVESKIQKAPQRLTENKIRNFKEMFVSVDKFKIKNNLLTEFINHKTGDREDAIQGREWKKASDSIMKALGFSDKELAKAKKSPAAARELVDNKFTEIAKDNKKFETTMTKLAEALGNFDSAMNKGALKGNKTFIEEVNLMTDNFYDNFAADARKASFTNVANYIAGDTEARIYASAKDNVKRVASNNVLGARSSLYRMVVGLDAYRRLQSAGATTKEANMAQKIKHVIIDGTYNDHVIKLGDLNSDEYKTLMNHVYGSEIDPVTKKALQGQKGLQESIAKSKEDFLHHVGDFYYKFKENSIIHPDRIIDHPDKIYDFNRPADIKSIGDGIKQAMTGKALSGFAQEAAGKISNTKNWLKLFGGIGAATAAVAMVSPVFFGKIKEPKQKKEVSYDA